MQVTRKKQVASKAKLVHRLLLLLATCLLYCSSLRMEAVCSSEISANLYWNTRRNILEVSVLHRHRCEDLKLIIFRGRCRSALLATSFTMVSCADHASTLTCSSETSIDFQRSTWHNIPDDRILNFSRGLFFTPLCTAHTKLPPLPMESLYFSIYLILPAALWPLGRLSL
jgi:hypothetical protein